jgi:hypothetical protein
MKQEGKLTLSWLKRKLEIQKPATTAGFVEIAKAMALLSIASDLSDISLEITNTADFARNIDQNLEAIQATLSRIEDNLPLR